MTASFDLSYNVLYGNSGTSKNKGTSLWNFALTLDSENFATAYRSTELEKGGSSEHDKLRRRRSTKLTIPPSSNAHNIRQALSTA